jgi:hypothetical protein
MKSFSAICFTLLLAAITAFPAHAQQKNPKNLQTADLDYLLYLIQGDNAQEAASAIAELGKRKTPESLDLLLTQLLLGYPPPMSKAMLQALGERKDPRALETLLFYAGHRSVELRTEALSALCELDIKDPAVIKRINDVLLKALSDYDEAVRNKSAWLLGTRRVAAAEEPLLKLFERGSTAAMQALGFVGGIRTAKALALAMESTKTSKEPLITTIGTLLSRPDFGPEPVRVQLVKILGETNLPGAQNVLMNYHADGPDAFMRSRKLAYQILSK